MKKALFILFFTLMVLKVLLIPLVNVPLGYSDSLAYFEQAKNFFETGSIEKVIETAKFPPLYGMILAPSYIFTDMNLVFLCMKLINVFLSSLIVFPAYFLAREFFNEKKSFMIATITAFLPSFFTMTFFVLSENLFYVLFLTTMFCLWKTYTTQKRKWPLLAGLGITLCLLTRFSSIVLILTVCSILIIHIFQKEKNALSKAIILLSTTTITLLPYFYARAQLFGWSLRGILLGYTPEVTSVTNGSFLLEKIIWIFIYGNYLIIGLGIILAILIVQLILSSTKKTKKEKFFIFFTAVLSFWVIAIAANNSGNVIPYTSHRIIGRYLACLFPSLLILGTLALEKEKEIKKSTIFIIAAAIAILTPFILFGVFFPINNTELIHVEILKILTEILDFPATLSVTIILTLSTLAIYFFRKIKTRTLLLFLLIYFIIISLLNTTAVIYDAQVRWSQLEEVQMGHWITRNLDPQASFLFDPENLEHFQEGSVEDRTDATNRPLTVIAYWIRGEIVNEKEVLNNGHKTQDNADYLLTNEVYNLELIHQEGNTYLYKL